MKAWHVCAFGFLMQGAGAVITLQFFENRELALLFMSLGSTLATFAAGWLASDHVRDRREEQAARELMANVSVNVRSPIQPDLWPDYRQPSDGRLITTEPFYEIVRRRRYSR